MDRDDVDRAGRLESCRGTARGEGKICDLCNAVGVFMFGESGR